MTDEDDIPLEELLKPLSAKVHPKRRAWADEPVGTRGDAYADKPQARARAALKMAFARKFQKRG